MIRRAQHFTAQAFALPTILIASVVMLIVILSAITTTISVNGAIDAQYYTKIGQEAGESGIAMATDCIRQNDSTSWANPLTPRSADCQGTIRSNCLATAPPADSCYVLKTPNMRTSFSVPTPVITSDGILKLTVESKVELIRTSNGQPWKTFTQSTVASVNTPNFDISSGNDTTCATVSGQLYCWGDNTYGQVGDGTQTDRPTPYKVTSGGLAGKYVYKGTSGFNHTCAIAGTSSTPTIGNSRIYCWGDNSVAQMGNGTIGTSPYLTPIAAALTLPADRVYTDISGSSDTCVIGANSALQSSVWCWGDNYTGESGDNYTNTPKKTPIEGTITADSGSIRYINNNSTTDSVANSTALTTATKINQVNSSIGCALTSQFTIYCWGSNASGGMGTGVLNNTTVNNRWRARIVGGAGVAATTSNYRFTDVVTNFARACAIGKTNGTATVDGKIYCWGGNGDDTTATVDYRTSSKETAYQWADVRSMITAGSYVSATFKAIALGDWTTCVLRSDGIYNGKVYCWGYNDLGQLGNNTVSGVTPASGVTPSTANKPISPENMVQVTGELSNKTVVKLTSGNGHFCAMTVSGASYCWGQNNHGQLGDGTTTNRSSPVRTKVPVTFSIF